MSVAAREISGGTLEVVANGLWFVCYTCCEALVWMPLSVGV